MKIVSEPQIVVKKKQKKPTNPPLVKVISSCPTCGDSYTKNGRCPTCGLTAFEQLGQNNLPNWRD